MSSLNTVTIKSDTVLTKSKCRYNSAFQGYIINLLIEFLRNDSIKSTDVTTIILMMASEHFGVTVISQLNGLKTYSPL